MTAFIFQNPAMVFLQPIKISKFPPNYSYMDPGAAVRNRLVRCLILMHPDSLIPLKFKSYYDEKQRKLSDLSFTVYLRPGFFSAWKRKTGKACAV